MAEQDRDMGGTTTVTVRLDKRVAEKLERLARMTKRTRSFHAAEAISEYVELNEWQIAGIKQGLAELDAGQGIPDEKVGEWLDSLSTDDEVPPPASDE